MCGIVGVVSNGPVNQLLYDSLLLLQHRGQDAAGIATGLGKNFPMHKGSGLVRDVFRTRNMRDLAGNAGIAQVRYPTAGSAGSAQEAQPFYVNAPFGITLAHNGNLTNWEQLKDEMFRIDRRHINTESDSEVLLNVLAHELQIATDGYSLDPDSIFKAVAGLHRRARRARTPSSRRSRATACSRSAIRSASGRWCSATARRTPAASTSSPPSRSRCRGWASSSCATSRRARRSSSTTTGTCTRASAPTNPTLNPCIFEYVYLARPDSVMDGISVYDARLRMGEYARREDPPRTAARRHRRRDADPRFEPAGRDADGAPARTRVPRRLHQEPLRRPHVHHAGAGRPQEVRAPEAEPDRASSSRARTC